MHHQLHRGAGQDSEVRHGRERQAEGTAAHQDAERHGKGDELDKLQHTQRRVVMAKRKKVENDFPAFFFILKNVNYFNNVCLLKLFSIILCSENNKNIENGY